VDAEAFAQTRSSKVSAISKRRNSIAQHNFTSASARSSHSPRSATLSRAAWDLCTLDWQTEQRVSSSNDFYIS
jgi:hypothetical protein